MENNPWPTIQSRRKAKDWRTELVKIGEEVLAEMEKHEASKDVLSRFRLFIEKAKSEGIHKT